jgi:thiol-disulfide isomerase/thioredoxin
MRHSTFTFVLLGLALAGTAAAQQGETPPKPAPAQEPKSQDPKPQDARSQDAKAAVLQVGDAVPEDVQLTDTAGKPFSFKEARGKVVAIHFWSTTCPWEKAAEPKLMQLRKDLDGKDAILVAINCNQPEIGEQPKPEAFAAKDPASRPYAGLRAKAEEVQFNHRILVDHGGTVGKLLQAKTTPHCFVVDKKGVLVYSGALDDSGRGEPKQHYLREAIEAALVGKKVETATTKPYG